LAGLNPCGQLFVGSFILLMLADQVSAQDGDAKQHTKENPQFAPLVQMLADELAYSMANLKTEDGQAPYFLGYTIYEEERGIVSASLGAINQDEWERERNLNIDLRVGDYKLDSTRQLRGQGGSRGTAGGSGSISIAIDDDPESIAQTLWHNTDRIFKEAAKRYQNVVTNLKIKVEEEDPSDDFSKEAPHVFAEPPVKFEFDARHWAERLKKISAIALKYPKIYASSVTIGTLNATRYMVTSEGTRLQTNEVRYRITLNAATKADDGMDLSQFDDFNASRPDKLPNDAEIEAAFRQVMDQVMALRDAPLAEPYIGPAILRNRASAVFFHEIFGHRIEGHRQKDVTEGQTFKKKIGQPILPTFISVHDDPSQALFGEIDLRGYYRFDDEGVASSKTVLVEDGVLKTFLMSRKPVEGFPSSNGHGRRSSGNAPVSRQANLIVESKNQVSYAKLRDMLVEECKKQDRPYGLLFDDISGGFTTTNRRGPQSFKVLPIVVYRVYADGRPDELIRGADVVGTPLTSFEKIVATGDDPAVFNGSCGAESGWVPVSAISPSILVSTIEIEKRQRDQSRPPILEPPLGTN